MDNNLRTKFFTSSQMFRLASTLKSGKPGQAFFGYVDEVFGERISHCDSDLEVKAFATKWGSLMEVVLFNLLGIGYKMTHKATLVHSKYSTFWSGTPDLIAEKIKIGEIKSFFPKAFVALSVCLAHKSIDKFRDEFPKEYWQCVSNAILCGLKRAEIIVYMPYEKELLEIIEQIEDSNFLEMNGLDPQDYYFMTRSDIKSLPHLPDDSPMSNVNSFEFDIPSEDIIFLTKRVLEAEKLANEKVDEYKKLIA